MQSSKQATSVIEAIVVLLIIVTGVVGMYSIYIQSLRLSNATAHKIEAIQIAREGIEGFINIRDSNWKIFGGDIPNCWNTLNYNTSCVGDITTATDISGGSYTIYQDSDSFWKLSYRSSGSYTGSYINNFNTGFPVGVDANGFYTQSGGLSVELMNPRYTREIQVSYVGGDSNGNEMNVSSVVQWKDNVSEKVHDIILDVVLTNWE